LGGGGGELFGEELVLSEIVLLQEFCSGIRTLMSRGLGIIYLAHGLDIRGGGRAG